MMRRNKLAACAAAMVLAGLAGCGGGDDSSGGGGGGGGGTPDAKAIDVGSMEGAKGEITYCQGKDTTGETKAWGKQFNEKHKSAGPVGEDRRVPGLRRRAAHPVRAAPGGEVRRLRRLPLRRHLDRGVRLAGLAYDLTPYIEDRRDEFIQPSIDTATYDGKIWGVPHYTNAALLYYRKDKIDEVPATWQDVYAQAADKGGIVFQGAAYEGLTCDWLELAYAAGGTVLSEDGKEATIDSPENVAATKLMADAVKSGAAPKAVATYMEPESLTAWQTGKPAMMRNWPYAYGLSQDEPKLKGKFDVAPLPSFEGAGKAAILGGGNNVISVYSKNPGGALAVVDFLAQQEWQTQLTAEFSQASPLKGTYDQPEVKKAIPFSDELRQALEQAKPRPVSPVYPQISQAIYKNVNQALTGQKSPEDAMKQAQSDIQKALETF